MRAYRCFFAPSVRVHTLYFVYIAFFAFNNVGFDTLKRINLERELEEIDLKELSKQIGI